MTDLSIYAQGLSKRYHIGKLLQRQDTLLNQFGASARAYLRHSGRLLRSRSTAYNDPDEIIWALKDVSFEVKQGEVIGIIGRNGAGKSTLLKILSRITEPTEGFADILGRVGSLLEVGTGFHPELTGRENIFLNGAILGMRKAEIDRKFDDIIEFAEIGKFIDTPVKQYSSGMYVRLAFAVAAHLEPEILIVDEVLAVGDLAFQKKCLGKMGDVNKQGRTVLFVSHNMVAVQSLCQRAIWLDEGRIIDEGTPNQVVSNYLSSSFSALTEQLWEDIEVAPGNDIVRIRKICIRSKNGQLSDQVTMDSPIQIEVEYWNLFPGAHLHVTLHIYTEQQIVAFTTGSSRVPEWSGRPCPAGLFRSTCHIPGRLLNSGVHRILLLIVQNGSTTIFRMPDAIAFDVLDMNPRSSSWFGKEPGIVKPDLKWETEFLRGLSD